MWNCLPVRSEWRDTFCRMENLRRMGNLRHAYEKYEMFRVKYTRQGERAVLKYSGH